MPEPPKLTITQALLDGLQAERMKLIEALQAILDPHGLNWDDLAKGLYDGVNGTATGRAKDAGLLIFDLLVEVDHSDDEEPSDA